MHPRMRIEDAIQTSAYPPGVLNRAMPLPMLSGANAWLGRHAEDLGGVGLYLFACFAWLGTTPATLGLALSTLAWLMSRPDWRALAHEPVALCALLFGGFVFLHSLIMAILAPSGTSPWMTLATGLAWLKLLLLIPVGHWCAGRPQRVRRLLLLGALGFTVAVLRKIDWAQFGPGFFTTRFESYLPAIAFGLLSGLGALGLVALRQAFWSWWGTWIWPGRLLWALWLAWMLEGLVLSQSRGSWLAFLGGLSVLLLGEWRARNRSGLEWLRQHPRQVLLIGLLLAGGLLVHHETLLKRFTEHTDTLVQIAHGTPDIASDPVGLRLKAWLFAFELWRERPWFGWGAGSSRTLIAHSNRPWDLFDHDHWLPHLHNTYLELLVQFGLTGLILFTSWLVALVWAGHQAQRSGLLPSDLWRLYGATLVCILIWCLFDYRAVHVDWLFLWLLIAGSLDGFKRAGKQLLPQDKRSGSPIACR